MKKKIDIFLSFLFYGLGLLSFLLADIYVTENFQESRVAQWAFYKSTIIIVGSILLLGYDQVFVRDPSLIKRFFKHFLIQALAIVIPVTVLISVFKGYSFYNGILLFIAMLFFGFLNYSTASLRANFNLWKSQFSLNFWKIILLGLLFTGIFNETLYFFIIPMFVSLVIAVFLGGYTTKEDKTLFENLENQDARVIANRFLLTNLTLILAVYGEQFLINLKGDTEASAHLFRYFSVFTPIALSVNGFLGFYFGPKLRRQKIMTISRFKSFSSKIGFFAILVTLVSSFVGYFYIKNIDSIIFLDVDWFLIISLSLICIVRGIYIATSVCLGIFADKNRLKSVALLFWVSALIYILGVFLTLNFYNGIIAAKIISVLSLINWVFRLLVSNFYTYRILNELNKK